MTAEKSIKILKAVKMLKDDAIGTLIDTTEAYKMAIEALSKQNESGEVDQFRGITKKTDSERVALPEQEKSNSFSKEPSEEVIHEMKCIPTLIRCKNCAHSTEWYGQKRRCFLWHEDGIDVWEDGFCNYADRKKQGWYRHKCR